MTTADAFMGSPDVPLSVDEYRRRYRPADVPHVRVSNPGDDTLRADVLTRGGVLVSVLLLPREACEFPTLETYSWRFVPAAFVGARG